MIIIQDFARTDGGENSGGVGVGVGVGGGRLEGGVEIEREEEDEEEGIVIAELEDLESVNEVFFEDEEEGHGSG